MVEENIDLVMLKTNWGKRLLSTLLSRWLEKKIGKKCKINIKDLIFESDGENVRLDFAVSAQMKSDDLTSVIIDATAEV